jgi:hypothetical protein
MALAAEEWAGLLAVSANEAAGRTCIRFWGKPGEHGPLPTTRCPPTCLEACHDR